MLADIFWGNWYGEIELPEACIEVPIKDNATESDAPALTERIRKFGDSGIHLLQLPSHETTFTCVC